MSVEKKGECYWEEVGRYISYILLLQLGENQMVLLLFVIIYIYIIHHILYV